MNKQFSPWLLAFFALAVLEIIAEIAALEPLVWCTKPLLMPLLVVWLVRETKGRRRFLHQTMQAGLLFATLGDILLMFSGGRYGTLFFLLGLGAFLCTHLCYTGGFFKETNLLNGALRRHPLLIVPFALYLAVLINWLWPGIPPGMRLPVTAYSGVITVMALSVVNWGHYLPARVFWTLFGGALLFMFSDSLIAINKFGHPFPGARIAIMITYLSGQWLLVRGVIANLRQPHTPAT